ncbi:MAG TPA: hypothetical protein PKC59_00865, partial [Burkholderiaceae bacterium]|nr:hypothetical protein [Burkholderiaceae bacterium]HMY99067.1 hypothetical protein [Burkholderiaceae bacterium]HNG77927.1 hypothetical protein [Burkholderiaceae bacterium]
VVPCLLPELLSAGLVVPCLLPELLSAGLVVPCAGLLAAIPHGRPVASRPIAHELMARARPRIGAHVDGKYRRCA